MLDEALHIKSRNVPVMPLLDANAVYNTSNTGIPPTLCAKPLDDGALDDAVDQQDHEADLFAGWGNLHERPPMGAVQGGHTPDQLTFYQFGLDRGVQVGKGGVQVRYMLARLIEPWMAVEDGPVALVKGAEHLVQDVLRGWC